MDFRTRVSRWEDWRVLMGAPSSWQRRNVSEFLTTRPALLYLGDSWFSTPLYANLARQSSDRIDGMAMLSGAPGATAAQLFAASKVRTLLGRLRSSPFDVLCLSAGGNDHLSERLAATFAEWMPGGAPAPARLDGEQAFALLMARGGFAALRADYTRLLDAVAGLLPARPHFRVVAHGYAPPVRIGAKGELNLDNIGLIAWLRDDIGPWLWRPMQHVLHDQDQARVFAQRLMAGFREEVLLPLMQPATFGAFFSAVDFTHVAGVDDPGFWYDEIHPTEAGFSLLADAFNTHLRGVLPAHKRAAVG